MRVYMIFILVYLFANFENCIYMILCVYITINAYIAFRCIIIIINWRFLICRPFQKNLQVNMEKNYPTWHFLRFQMVQNGR